MAAGHWAGGAGRGAQGAQRGPPLGHLPLHEGRASSEGSTDIDEPRGVCVEEECSVSLSTTPLCVPRAGHVLSAGSGRVSGVLSQEGWPV